jgi:C4-dicarboxylate transporter DctM subunit
VWTEELARTVFLYVTFVGAGLALAKNAHLRIDAAVKLLPPMAQVVTQVATHLIAIVFLAFVVYQSSLMLPRLSFQPLTALPFLSKAWFFASVPIGCSLMLAYELWHLWTYVKQIRRPGAIGRG